MVEIKVVDYSTIMVEVYLRIVPFEGKASRIKTVKVYEVQGHEEAVEMALLAGLVTWSDENGNCTYEQFGAAVERSVAANRLVKVTGTLALYVYARQPKGE